MAKPPGLRWGLALAALTIGVGCAPIQYFNTVTRHASTSVEAAKSAQADKYAPYYYTLALEYLHKAREEAAAADYQSANRFGRKADWAAKKAKQLAIKRAADPEWKPAAPAPQEAPLSKDRPERAEPPAQPKGDAGGGE